ncbi:MAG TPA: hypothetical protein VF494_10395 [Candidatus Limnocylindrales bacterium]
MTAHADPNADAPADPHASDATTGPHGGLIDQHGADHGRDDHASPAEAVGPVDTTAWAAGILGLALGLAVVLAIAIASGTIG